MNFDSMKSRAITTIELMFLEKLREHFPNHFFESYKENLLIMVKKEIIPVCTKIIDKNEKTLRIKLNSIIHKNIDKEEKQIEFNSEINSLFNIFGKISLLQKTYLVQKDGINYIKFKEEQFSKNLKKQKKEKMILSKLENKYF